MSEHQHTPDCYAHGCSVPPQSQDELTSLRAELAEREKEVERLRTDLKKECLLAQERLGQLETATVVIYNERQRSRLPAELVERLHAVIRAGFGRQADRDVLRDILAAVGEGKE